MRSEIDTNLRRFQGGQHFERLISRIKQLHTDDLCFAATPPLAQFTFNAGRLMALTLVSRNHFTGITNHFQFAFFNPGNLLTQLLN